MLDIPIIIGAKGKGAKRIGGESNESAGFLALSLLSPVLRGEDTDR
jgi:hypothetical protein